jgi:hypothetical protein
MADLKINITATDRASTTINAVGKSMANLGKTAGAALKRGADSYGHRISPSTGKVSRI